MKRIGIYNPNLHTKGGGEKVCLALAEALAEKYDVTLISHIKVAVKDLESYFAVDLSKVKVVHIRPSRTADRLQNRGLLTEALRRTIRNFDIFSKIKALNFDVFINNAYNTDLPSPARTGVYMCMFPSKLPDKSEMSGLKRQYAKSIEKINSVLMHSTKTHWLDTYKVITANSAFTQSYISKYWNRSSDIVYPICDSMAGRDQSAQKQNIIFNAGRYFHNDGIQHHKRQDFLLDTFIKMPELHDEWQLHFAGTVNQNGADMHYVLDLLKRADGYPVYFHYDTPRDKLKELNNKAKVYWHATGYGSDPKKSPERQEHFGITTVEAMSTGAIPVVINSAGQKEVVTDGLDGFLWKTEAELISKTKQAIINQADMTKTVRLSSSRFDKDAFRSNVAEVFSPLLDSK